MNRISKSKTLMIKFYSDKAAVLSAVFIIFLALIALSAPLLTSYNPTVENYDAILQSPNKVHLFGTDEYGRDLFARVVYGSRISLLVGLSSVFMGMVIGVVAGLIAGFYGGILDSIIMRIADLLFAFPGIILAIAIVAILGPGMSNVIIAVAVFSVPSFARIVRANTMSLKNSLYVRAAVSIGSSNGRLLFKHLLPSSINNIIVFATLRIGTSILTASSLSFLGLGAQPPTPEWGALLSSGRTYIGVADHLTMIPGLAIFLTVLSFNLLGNGIRSTFDVKDI